MNALPIQHGGCSPVQKERLVRAISGIQRRVIVLLVVVLVASLAVVVPSDVEASPDDYYLYANWNPGVGYTTGVNGYVDTNGLTGWGDPGDEYIIFTGGPSYGGHHIAYVYRVTTVGDPNMHPDNPEATGPVSPRTFTLVSTYDMGNYASGHENAFYVDDTGIYYGAAPGWHAATGCGIRHWDFNWNILGCVVPTAAPPSPQTLARNPTTGDWWIGMTYRQLYKWDGGSWVYQFTHPNLSGDHHDGMEIIDDSLFISDMTSDVIIQYRLDASGNVIDPPGTPYNTFTYSGSPPVEGMGFGPNQHIWISGWSSGTVYELGGGALQVALEGIPDQCIFTGENFDTFDLDIYMVGSDPFDWGYVDPENLAVSIDGENVCTVTYTPPWTGSESITFTGTDSEGKSDNDEPTFTVCPVPVVGNIPNQVLPFQTFDLDDYLSGINPEDVTWSASNPGPGWTVDIDPDNVVTVTPPGGSIEPVTVTFTATTVCCDRSASDSDDATFGPPPTRIGIPLELQFGLSGAALMVVFFMVFNYGRRRVATPR